MDVRLKGREPQFVVTPPTPPETSPAAEPAPGGTDETYDEEPDGAVARITLRLPEALKQRAEEAAGKRGQSLNTWLVNAVRAGVRERALDIDLDLSSLPFGFNPPGRARRWPGQHVSGWAR